jgi:hypothetical protein
MIESFFKQMQWNNCST